jgi:membrane protease YdiL (CAAX protease family)
MTESQGHHSSGDPGSYLDILWSPYVEMVSLAVFAVLLGNAFSMGVGVGIAAAGATLGTLGAIGVSVLSLQVVGMLGTALTYLWIRNRWDLLRVRWPPVRALALIGAGVLVAFVLNIVRTVAMVALDLEASSPIVDAGTGTNATTVLLAMIAVSFLVIAPLEELLFRGLIQGRLSEVYGSTVGVLTASALFALMHLPGFGGVLGGRLLTVLGLFAVSLVFGWLYERTGNLVIPWAVHGLYNASLFGILYAVVVSGGV